MRSDEFSLGMVSFGSSGEVAKVGQVEDGLGLAVAEGADGSGRVRRG